MPLRPLEIADALECRVCGGEEELFVMGTTNEDGESDEDDVLRGEEEGVEAE